MENAVGETLPGTGWGSLQRGKGPDPSLGVRRGAGSPSVGWVGQGGQQRGGDGDHDHGGPGRGGDRIAPPASEML